jgi:propionyl-CoA synthetase
MPGAFWRVISEYGVAAFFTAPTALRSIKKEDPAGSLIPNYDLSRLRTLFLAGERADPDTVHWAERVLGIPVIDHWWQTETAGQSPAIRWASACCRSRPVRRRCPCRATTSTSSTRTVMRFRGASSAISWVKLPLPPGCLPTLWNADDQFGPSYTDAFPGFYKTADAGYQADDGYLFIMGRTDDVINVAGHRLSTGAMEEVLSSHKDVAECAVIGAADALKGELPVGFVVLKAGVARDSKDIESEVVALVRERIGPVAAFKTVRIVGRLPKTRSGKILRGTIKKIADGAEFKVPATIDDPTILGEIRAILSERPIAG